ncbi:MAG: hypothetical protein KF690_06855 [Bacteroidetes bacterium]|nr:hypothetical protein [Bacteroidota bacterium]
MMAIKLAQDLLEQARHLAHKEPKRPKQASLRRAVSAAYYTLFHHLVGTSCTLLFSNTQRSVHAIAARAFEHTSIKEACTNFNKQPLPPKYRDLVDYHRSTPESELEVLRHFAATFIRLQDLRHDADYNLDKSFEKLEVFELIDEVQQAILNLRELQDRNRALLRVFCAACLFKKQSKLL